MAENNGVSPQPSIPIPPNNHTHPFSVMTIVVNMKLDTMNYPLGRDLMGYVDGTLACPPKNLPGVATVNPTYTSWIQQNQMILSWINGSFTASVLSIVASKRSARATWEALE
ncbi:hypothetical protein D8674_009337 [Pyrus ussuriensis x Pyrus communis]|uniref:Retrotransposon Copia-like N-terminal domain-containing protein n=1 Tax=Pyrus ussuriensis x Pyrus communis TaxID=2448454 RepID=A0A5N5F7N6_9ROSA|nr:hypothetical protein D8674_009337 [Pyrus ussuriensis x Pyrus communis]